MVPSERIDLQVLGPFERLLGASAVVRIEGVSELEQGPSAATAFSGNVVSLFSRFPAGSLPGKITITGKVGGEARSWILPVTPGRNPVSNALTERGLASWRDEFYGMTRGHESKIFSPARQATAEAPPKTTADSRRRCCGSGARGRPGATCPRSLATGLPRSRASRAGPRALAFRLKVRVRGG